MTSACSIRVWSNIAGQESARLVADPMRQHNVRQFFIRAPAKAADVPSKVVKA